MDFFYEHAGKSISGWFRFFRGCLFYDFFYFFFVFLNRFNMLMSKIIF